MDTLGTTSAISFFTCSSPSFFTLAFAAGRVVLPGLDKGRRLPGPLDDMSMDTVKLNPQWLKVPEKATQFMRDTYNVVEKSSHDSMINKGCKFTSTAQELSEFLSELTMEQEVAAVTQLALLSHRKLCDQNAELSNFQSGKLPIKSDCCQTQAQLKVPEKAKQFMRETDQSVVE